MPHVHVRHVYGRYWRVHTPQRKRTTQQIVFLFLANSLLVTEFFLSNERLQVSFLDSSEAFSGHLVPLPSAVNLSCSCLRLSFTRESSSERYRRPSRRMPVLELYSPDMIKSPNSTHPLPMTWKMLCSLVFLKDSVYGPSRFFFTPSPLSIKYQPFHFPRAGGDCTVPFVLQVRVNLRVEEVEATVRGRCSAGAVLGLGHG